MSDLNDIKNVKPLDDFNWDEFENGTSSSVSKEEQAKAYEGTMSKIQDHEVVEGIVISIDKKEVVVNIGYKSDGIIKWFCLPPDNKMQILYKDYNYKYYKVQNIWLNTANIKL